MERTPRVAELPVFETPTACAGAAASYVLRRIAYRAGAFAPGIDTAIFDELHATCDGGAIDDVERWLARRVQALRRLGYDLLYRCVVSPTRDLRAWIEAGRGYRGAVLATSYLPLHPPDSPDASVGDVIAHAVGLAIEPGQDGEGELVMIDPWSHTGRTRSAVPVALDIAHRARDHRAIALHWASSPTWP